MRVLIAHNHYRSSSPSGENRVVEQEHRALVNAGHDVRHFERRSDEIASLPMRQRALVPVEAVWNRRSASDLASVLAEFRPDVVHLHNLFPLLSASVLDCCHRNRVPCVATLHNYQHVCLSGLLYRTGANCHECVGRTLPLPALRHGCSAAAARVPLFISSVAHRKAWRTIPSAYIYLSDAQRREMQAVGFPPDRSFVKSNMVEAAPQRRAPEDLVVFLGRLTETKGVRVLMQAWDAYAATGSPALRLAIAGSGPLETEIRYWASLRPSVEMMGLLGRDGCADLLSRALAVVVPSVWQEPFGLVVAEAMAAGAAPIASAHAALSELITEGVDGLLFPPGDAPALASAFRRVEAERAWLAALGSQARHTYETRFAPEVIVAQLEAIYGFAVANPRWEDPTSSAASPAQSAAHLKAATDRPWVRGSVSFNESRREQREERVRS